MKQFFFFVATFIAFTSFAQQKGYKPGDKAIDFKLKNTNGNYVSLSDYKNAKGFIVVFTCNHCPYAKAYQDRINDLNKKYLDQGYPLIAINADDSADNSEDSYSNMQLRAKEKGYSFPYLLDATQQIALAYGATRTPHAFVLQKDKGALIVKYIGAIDDNTDNPSAVTQKYVEMAVDALLAGKEVAITSTKAIGCGIKFKSKTI